MTQVAAGELESVRDGGNDVAVVVTPESSQDDALAAALGAGPELAYRAIEAE